MNTHSEVIPDAPADALFGTSPPKVRPHLRRMGEKSAADIKSPDDVALIQAQLERTKKDLERAQTTYRRQSEQDTAQLIRAQAAVVSAHDAFIEEPGFFKRQFRFLVLAGVGTLVVAIAGGFLAVRSLQNPAHLAPVETATTPGAPEPVTSSLSSPTDFSQGVARLSRAFSKFPAVAPETILRAVNKKASKSGSSVCAFAWNNGQPALQYGGGNGADTSLSGAFTRCAAAVERYR